VLAAIPANLPPAYRPLTAEITVPGLCESVISTAARLQHGAATFARTARWSAQATSASWRHDALASAITADSSEVIIRSLAQCAASLGLHPAIQGHLDNSAHALKLACTAWRAVTGEWDLLSTGTHKRAGLSPVAAEMDDLVLRIGRLAYRNPGWTPACGDASLARNPGDLAPDADTIPTVLAAVHHAIDTLTHIAVTDRRCVCQAAADHRLYIPHRCHHSPRRPCARRRSYIPRAGRSPHRSCGHQRPSAITGSTAGSQNAGTRIVSAATSHARATRPHRGRGP
jgi:hypothetical protein